MVYNPYRKTFTAPRTNKIGVSTPAIDPSLIGPPDRTGQPSPVTEHEVAFLIRHFGETAGQW